MICEFLQGLHQTPLQHKAQQAIGEQAGYTGGHHQQPEGQALLLHRGGHVLLHQQGGSAAIHQGQGHLAHQPLLAATALQHRHRLEL